MKEYYGFIYQWVDASNGFKYIGSHYGTVDDGYVSSNNILNSVYKSRPYDVTRTILEYIKIDDKKFMYEREQFYLDMIPDDELYTTENRKNKTYKYYNMKKHAAGGNGVGSNGALRDKRKYYHKDTLVQKFFFNSDEISDEWIKGVPQSKASGSGKKWYTNLSTGENKRLEYNPGDGWVCGHRNITSTPKKVSTPYGIFESANECSRQTGIKSGTVTFRCRSTSTKMSNWFYIEE